MAADGALPSVDVVAAAVVRDGAVLATQRGYGEHAGGWEFPGGKVEDGESAEEALVREIREELEVAIEVDAPLCVVEHDYEAFHLHMACFVTHIAQGEPTLVEHRAARWVDARTIGDVDWLPADVKVARALMDKGVLDKGVLDKGVLDKGVVDKSVLGKGVSS